MISHTVWLRHLKLNVQHSDIFRQRNPSVLLQHPSNQPNDVSTPFTFAVGLLKFIIKLIHIGCKETHVQPISA